MADTSPNSPSAPASSPAPWPGSQRMPRWNKGELVDAPRFTWQNWFFLLGPALVVGGSAIGGGEWLVGPKVTARYGGALLWLATISIIGQVIYNIEISRYTLYCGEPIFTGKFRTFPGPKFWLLFYLLLDFGAFIPYLAANAAEPAAALVLGRPPEKGDMWLIRLLAYVVFFVAMTPLIFGGKIYNTLKAVMTFKIVAVLGFLLFLAVFHSNWSTWRDLGLGFLRFGTVPVQRAEDVNKNGVLDPGEDWDGDGRLDGVEAMLETPRDVDGDMKIDTFMDDDGDGIRDGDNLDNVFVSLWQGRGLPVVDLTMIALMASLAAIAGNGGLSNVPLSNYTRDQGWGMGRHVGAIPSVVGGHHLQLSHVGMVFDVTAESLPRWRRWMRHLSRDQLAVWMPACFLGMALPSMLSMQFLSRGQGATTWNSTSTAGGVKDVVTGEWGATWGTTFWWLTIFCGFLCLGPSVATQADGTVRRWVDVIWTSSARLRKWDPHRIRYLYFGVLVGFMGLALTVLTWGLFRPGGAPVKLVNVAANFNNMALAFSCFHTLFVNTTLLPKPLRPHWLIRLGLVLTGLFFSVLFVLTTIRMVKDFANF